MTRRTRRLSAMCGERDTGLSKLRRVRFFRSLSAELLAALAVALAVAAVVYHCTISAAYAGIDQVIFDAGAQGTRNAQAKDDLQQYVTENGVSGSDVDAFDQWAGRQKARMFTVYRDDTVLYDSSGLYRPGEMPAIYDEYGNRVEGSAAIETWQPSYLLQLADGAAMVWMFDFGAQRYYTFAYHGVLAFVGVVFLVLFLLAIRSKTRYIYQLEKELALLEGGDLEHPITIKGKDELGELAASIDAMRTSIIQRQAGEEAARQANQELITAMSHDLRTPLTSLIGYLDILTTRRYQNEEQARTCLENSRKKAYELKDLSDKLFEFFLVYGREDDPKLETVDCGAFLMQTLEEGLFLLEDQGFSVERDTPDPRCLLRVDVGLLRRALDNMVSNLRKYADPSVPLKLRWRQRDGRFELELSNRVRTAPKVQSTGLGLKTCERILALHGGSFETREENGWFTVHTCLPCQQLK